MRDMVRRTVGALGVFAIVGLVVAAPAAAVVFTISGGVAETGGITTPCSPCVPAGSTGIPVGTQGYVAQNATGGAAVPMSLNATPGTIIFHYLGSDAALRNQFLLDLDRNGSFETLVFDNQRAANPDFVFSNTVNGAIPFEYVFGVGGTNTPVPGNPSTTFGIFEACLPQSAGDPNPRTCSQGYIGLADGTIFNANDDHQDLGVSFRTPEPGSLILLGAGLFGLGLVSLRRRKA